MNNREKMEFDVVIAGAGPAGLAAAVRLGQLNQRRQKPALTVAVIEKGGYVGAHLLAGAVLETSALSLLMPDWESKQAPLDAPVSRDQFLILNRKRSWRLPVPPTMRNRGNHLVSLELLCQWLAEQAEALGVNIFPGFAANELIFSADGKVLGVRTGDKGLNADGTPGENFQAGIDLIAGQTILAEGCRGSLSEQIMRQYDLREDCDPQSYGLGLKEIWEVDSAEYQPGLVTHTVGWPLDNKTYGGGFIYHFNQHRISLGFVVGLDYQNPYLDPFQEFQRFKTHPRIRSLLAGGKCVGYGARSLNEGGFQSLPKLTFPGGLLVGCAAGFLNVGKIKGIHNAIKSGLLAAETIAAADLAIEGEELTDYSQKILNSSIIPELRRVRNLRPGFHYGLKMGMAMAAVDQYLFRGKAPWTLRYRQPDYKQTKPARDCVEINYPPPDRVITFDKLTQVYLSGAQQREGEPNHLRLKDPEAAVNINWQQFAGLEQRYCPAAVYEFVIEDGATRLQINAGNCLHCKACDIKDPTQNIVWTVPEGGDGPNYIAM